MRSLLLWLCLASTAHAAPEEQKTAIAIKLMAAESLERRLSTLSAMTPSSAVDEAFLLLEALVSSGRTSTGELRGFTAWWAEGTPIQEVLDQIETGGPVPGTKPRIAGEDGEEDLLMGFSEERQRFTLAELSPLVSPPLPLDPAPTRALECPVSVSLSAAGELEGARAPSCPEPWASQIPELLEAWTWPAPRVGGATAPGLVSLVLLLHPEGEARLPAPPDPNRAVLPWLSAPEREAAETRWAADQAHLVVDPVDGHWEVLDGGGAPIDALQFAERIGDERAARRARQSAALDRAGAWIFVGTGAALALSAIVPLAGLESAEEPVEARYEVNPLLYDDEQEYLEAVTKAAAEYRDDVGYWRSATARDETRILTAGALVVAGGMVAAMAPAHNRAAKDRTPTVPQVFRRKDMEDKVQRYNDLLRQELGLPPSIDLGATRVLPRQPTLTVRWGGGLTLVGRFQ